MMPRHASPARDSSDISDVSLRSDHLAGPTVTNVANVTRPRVSDRERIGA